MRKISRPLIALLGLALLALPAGASGLMTIGQLASAPQPRCNTNRPLLLWQDTVASGPGYMVPASGAITSWSTNASVGEGQIYNFRVLRPLRAERFRVVAHDGPRTLTQSQLNTFQIAIPVKAGDVLALSSENSAAVNTACVFSPPTFDPADSVSESTHSPADGEAISILGRLGDRVNVSATFLPPPAIATLSPASGPPEGGSAVTISGANFATVKSVSFGTIAAKSFTVNSESRITAIAPPGEASTQVTVTTVAGSATETFSYTSVTNATSGPSVSPERGCLVPKLKARKLKAAKKMLRKAGCGLGRVRTVRRGGAKPGSVLKQSPKAGTQRPAGTKVSVTVSPQVTRR
jgi:hypothetical protein